MPDQADPPGLIARAREWVEGSYPFAVVRRFVELELLERSVALSAQAFIALLPIIILVVSVFSNDVGTAVSEQIGDRFGLDRLTRDAIRALFAEQVGQRAVSWLAVLMVLVSAFSLARRLARVYASVFDVPPLQRRDNWRGLVWILLQVAMIMLVSTLRQVRDDGGLALAAAAVIALIAVWFGTDVAALRLLVPAVPTRLIAASAAVSTFGRVLFGAWAAVYLSHTLAEQAERYGPIGLTFSIYTYLLVGVLVYVCAPLLVTTWLSWRADRAQTVSAQA
ncbi:MAG: hypothetical protein GC156_10660 [Actinomycetales bacterium]|nr:hypothetical protein [Actinomycetales bacterium]